MSSASTTNGNAPFSSPGMDKLETPATCTSTSTGAGTSPYQHPHNNTNLDFEPMFTMNGTGNGISHNNYSSNNNNNHLNSIPTNTKESNSMMTSIDEDSVEVMMTNNESKDGTEMDKSNANANVNAPPAALHSRSNRRPSTLDLGEQLRMSTVSGLYDRQHKGFLDPTEMAMRRMDSQNRGYLDNEKVYTIMSSLQEEQKKSAVLIESLQKEQKKAMSLKRGIMYMSVLALFLALSNIGTSFAAARLAKDITVNGQDLVAVQGSSSSSQHTRLATTSKNVVLQLDSMEFDTTDPERRRLQERFLQEANALACGPETVVDFDNGTTGDNWETGETDSITGDTDSSGSPTVQCNTVGRITYESAQQLYAEFCTWPQPADATTPVGCDLGLAELLLVCGSRKTRILGGNAFPTGGVPDLEASGQYFVFPSPERDVPVGESMSLYFSALQLVEEPRPQFSLTSNPPPMTCEERFHFKLYCDPTNGQGCLLIALLWNNQKNCQGEIQMCATSSGVDISRRNAGLRSRGIN